MRKLTAKERLKNWERCSYALDFECDQCTYYLQFDNQELHANDGYDGICDLTGRMTYSDDSCYVAMCRDCANNQQCETSAKAKAFIEDLPSLSGQFEPEDVLLFQSLLLNNILCEISVRCPNFRARQPEKQMSKLGLTETEKVSGDAK
jgi:hypothetical protein